MREIEKKPTFLGNLTDTKNGEDRTIPLSEKAFLIL